MRLFTARGDQGDTDLLGARVSKADPRIGVLGALDEATSALGLGRALAVHAETKDAIIAAQRDLYHIMAELAFTDEVRPDAYALASERVDWVTRETDRVTAQVTLPRAFVLPGESAAGAALDVARTVVRRAERELVLLGDAAPRNPELVRYLNRLSSLAFVLARFEDAAAGAPPRRAKVPAAEAGA